jgi:hypothetical protein
MSNSRRKKIRIPPSKISVVIVYSFISFQFILPQAAAQQTHPAKSFLAGVFFTPYNVPQGWKVAYC